MKKSRSLFFTLFVLFLVSSCENNREVVPSNNFNGGVSVIFKTRDCGQCHDALILGPGVKMKSDPYLYSDIMKNWVLKTPAGTSITISEYKKSNMYLAINQNGTDLKAMKPQADLLSAQDITIINKWLEAGAPEK